MRRHPCADHARRSGGALIGALLLAGACGHQPVLPLPSPSPSPRPGGTLEGAYLFRVEAAAECGLPAGTFTFPLTAAPAPTPRHPAFQALDDPSLPLLQAELQYGAPEARGGIGTTEEGVLSREGLRMWTRAIGAGTVSTEGTGPGEIPAGALTGYLAFAPDGAAEGALGACFAAHRFSLRRR